MFKAGDHVYDREDICPPHLRYGIILSKEQVNASGYAFTYENDRTGEVWGMWGTSIDQCKRRIKAGKAPQLANEHYLIKIKPQRIYFKGDYYV